LFDITRAASETQSKPHPQMLQEILSYTGVAPEQAIMVGDSSYDLQMAQNIEMPRVGVSYGVHSVDVLQQYKPLMIADDVTALHHYLVGLPSKVLFYNV
jgi:phosphoglycolate phosphatase